MRMARPCCARRSPLSDAGALHALGLALVRLKRSDEALDLLRRAAEAEPERARYAYVYAVGLNSAGRGSEAVRVLKKKILHAIRMIATRCRRSSRSPTMPEMWPARSYMRSNSPGSSPTTKV